MRLTCRSEYAPLALVDLARRPVDQYATVQAIAKAQKIPPTFLEQILLALKRAQLLRSHKGKGGGYRLARPAAAISLAEVIRLFDGALAPTESVSKYFYEPTPIQQERSLLQIFQAIRDFVSDTLEGTSVADVSGAWPTTRSRSRSAGVSPVARARWPAKPSTGSR